MTFTPEQIEMMKEPLDPKYVVEPSGKFGPKGDYIYGWHAINEANRILGFDGWSYIVELSKVSEITNENNNIEIGYICKCTVTAGGVTRQDVGYGSGAAKKHGDACEGAVKEAATDALKRCLRTFGNPFGLALYDKGRENVGVKIIKISPDDVQVIKSLAGDAAFDVGVILKRYGVKALDDLTADQGEKSIKRLGEIIEEQRIEAAKKEDEV